MTNLDSAVLAAAARRSPFAGLDVCTAAGLAVTPGGKRPRFGELLWDFNDLLDLPVHLVASELKLDFSKIRNPLWQIVAQEFVFARLAPDHEAVRELPHAFRVPLAIRTIHARLLELVDWFNWLTQRGITTLRDVDQQICQAYYLFRMDLRDKHGVILRAAADSRRLSSVQAVQEPAWYAEMFSADTFADGFVPWAGRSPFAVAGCKNSGENSTKPMRQEALQPWLSDCLHIVETLGPHLVALTSQVREDSRPLSPSEHVWRQRILAIVENHLANRSPLETIEDQAVVKRLAQGWDEHDPLLRFSFKNLANEAGMKGWHARYTPEMRPILERAVAQVGLAPRYGRDAALVPRADKQGDVPWTGGIPTSHEVIYLTEKVRTACMVVVALLTGMRASELMAMPVDAALPPKDLGGGRLRYRLRTKLIKGRKEMGGVWEEWVTIAQAHNAVRLAVELLDPKDHATHVFGRASFIYRCQNLAEWINGSEGQRLGLTPLPDDPISLRITRRTLAMELAHRPGGLLAAKIHLKHVTVVTTEGYAASPGGSQARFLADVSKEEQHRNRTLTLEAFREFQGGTMPAGPGARSLIDFFTSVDEKLKGMETATPGVKPGDQEVCNLLARRAQTLHLGIANYCWFMDPSKALCLILAGTPAADRPLAGMCDSARCAQATHHPRHRPVWADSAENKKVFIGSIGRSQKTEKARLQADYQRDLRVLAEIDAAAGTGA